MAIKKFEDNQMKMSGFEDYVKYVAYDEGGEIDSFDDYYQAEEIARETPTGYVEKVTYDYNGDEIESETMWGGYKVIAKQEYGDGNGIDNCAYDDILVFLDLREFEPGSGHEGKYCTQYADYANYWLGDDAIQYFNYTEDILNFICEKLEEEFGGLWDYDVIRGSVQRESEYIVFNKDNHHREGIDYFENDYFNIGYEYACYVDGKYDVSVWVNALDDKFTLDIIADATGFDKDDIYIESMY